MKKNIAIVVLSIALVLCVAVGGTLAYLTAQTDAITNTFTYGNVALTLEETCENNFKLIPGKQYDKDPKITLSTGSEDAYLYVRVDSQVAGLVEYELADNWTLVDGTTNVYNYTGTIIKGTAISVLKGDKVTIAANVVNGTGDKTLTFTGYAVQKDQFNTAKAAWDATFGAPPAQG